MSLNSFLILYHIYKMPSELQAYVVRIFPTVTRKTKDGSDFVSQKVLVEWNRDQEFPSRMVLEQWGDKKIEVVKGLQEWHEYIFSLNFRANEWKDANWNETAFGSISAWKAEEMHDWASEESLPF